MEDTKSSLCLCVPGARTQAHRPMLQQLLRDLQQASLSEEGEIEGPGDGAGEVEPGQVQQTPPPAGDGGGAGGTPSSGAKAPLGATAAKAHAAWQAVVDEVRETMPNPVRAVGDAEEQRARQAAWRPVASRVPR